MNKAANISNKHWPVSGGVSTFESSRAWGVLNADGTHALGKSGDPSSWHTKRAASTIAKYADEMADGDVYEWVPVYDSAEEACGKAAV